MKKELKAFLKKNPMLYSLALIISHRKNADFLQYVIGAKENPNYIRIMENEKEDSVKRPACIISVGTHNDGFFACVRWALDGLYFCDRCGFLPYIEFSKDSIYKDENVFEKEKNVFEYYFENVCEITPQNIVEHSIVEYTPRNALLAERMNGGVNYEVTEKYISEMARIAQKYIRFNEKTISVIKNALDDLNVNNDTLGIHIRGTDYKSNYKNHPIFVEVTDYYPHIDYALDKLNFKKIFVATDDQQLLDELIRHYGSKKVIFNHNIKRSTGKIGVHTSCYKEKTPYYLGLDVICDMEALKSCGGLISGMSQVALIARIMKKSEEEEFLYDQIINKGVNKRGKLYLNK